ncbi:pseudouridine synthase [Bacteroides sp. 224]|uniref:pseudouridine synthase n=1 Tax=Bacteroides sp. 224 TaxID=2302936 RepID=UPI0013D4490E|nr:pseudouridine synthase [Bacteroides sp. 224]NDV66772.1 pseudouridine synthase [Bacteroides sp. 224]
MNTGNENWQENPQGEDANRDGNRDDFNRWDNNRSYNRDSSYNREERSNSSYGDRPKRPRFNREAGGSEQRSSYNSYDRPQRTYNREGGERSYNREGGNRPSYNREGGERSSYNRSYYNREGGDRPYRPRFNREGGEQNSGYNNNRFDRPQRSYNNNREDKPWRSNNGEDRRSQYGNTERKPWQNNSGDGGDRPRFRKPNTGYGNSSYDNRGGGDRPYRPRYNNDGRSQGFQRPVRRDSNYDPNAKYTRKKQIEYKEQFVDPNEPIRLNKFMANAGVCSRREADEFITAGAVSVNGEVVTELGTKIKRSDVVKFHDEAVSVERKMYILLNKPKDCVTTSDDPQSRLTVMDLVKGACNERIYPVGRLDRNTTGVLLLTNDGDLASKLTHPKFLKKKIYYVTTDKNVTKADMDQIAAGVKLDDETEINADAISYTDEIKRNLIGIEIHSGQNRIVRRIFESLGYKVMKLDRVYFAGLTKKGLKRGDWRYLTENEVSYLRMGSFN